MHSTPSSFHRLHTALAALCLLVSPARAQAASGPGADVPPASKEPLHIVRHDVPPFLIYTNHLLPGVWTQFHHHRTDLLAVIAADVQTLAQPAGEAVSQRAVSAGTTMLFPYADAPAPYVHRVGVAGEQPFINVGLEFHEPPAGQCRDAQPWQAAAIESAQSNRRGTAYRVRLAAGARVDLPAPGAGARALLIVPLTQPAASPYTLRLDAQTWTPTLGEFRFFTAGSSPWPTRLANPGERPQSLSIFIAC